MRAALRTRSCVLRFWRLGQAHAEAHIFRDRHMWIERIGLEHHGHATLCSIDVVDTFAIEPDFAAGDFLQTSNGSQQCRFPAPGRPDEDDEFTGRYIEVDVFEDFDGPVILGGVENL